MISRRSFQEQLACIAGVTLASTRFVPCALGAAKQNSDRRIVTVFLNGGNDGLNTVIPARDPLYRHYRRDLRIAAEEAISLDQQMFLHPALTGLVDTWNDGRLNIQQGVGYPNHSRSHFESTAVWSEGRLGAKSPSFDGWLSRTLDPLQSRTKSPLACAIDSFDTPELLRGRHTRTTTLPDVNPAEAGHLAKLLDQNVTSNKVDELQRLISSACRDAGAALRTAVGSKHRHNNFPENSFGQRMGQVAAVIDAMPDVKAIHVVQNGYDTHTTQRVRHTGLLREFGQGLRALDRFLVQRGQSESTLVMVFSEFGRRVKENASAGTDHGAAGPVFLMGGGVSPGLRGKNPNLEQLNQGDITVTQDLRELQSAIGTWLVSPDATLDLPD